MPIILIYHWTDFVQSHASAIDVISEPGVMEFPVDITRKEVHAEHSTILDHRPLTLRHPKQRALFRVQAAIQNAFGDYFGRQAFLAQSPQFYKQMMVGILGRVYEVAPVHRAEKHITSRHLNEYVSVDLELQIDRSFHEIMQVEARRSTQFSIASGRHARTR